MVLVLEFLILSLFDLHFMLFGICQCVTTLFEVMKTWLELIKQKIELVAKVGLSCLASVLFSRYNQVKEKS